MLNMFFQTLALCRETAAQEEIRETRETSECQAVTSEDLEDPMGQDGLVGQEAAALEVLRAAASDLEAVPQEDQVVQEVQVDLEALEAVPQEAQDFR